MRSSSMPRPGVGSPLRPLAAQSAPSLTPFSGAAPEDIVMSPDDFPALGSGAAGGSVRQPTVWMPQGALQAAALPLKNGPPAAAAASSVPASPELRRTSENRNSLSSWAEVSSRRPSNGASPRGAEYHPHHSSGLSAGLAGPRGLPQRLHSAEGGGRHLAVVTMPYSAPASVAGGASPPAGSSVIVGTTPGAPSTVSEALDGSSSAVGSASPRSSIASAPPATGRGAAGAAFASAPPTLEGGARSSIPPPATTTEYPPLPTSGRSSGVGRGPQELGHGPQTGRDSREAPGGAPDGDGGSNGTPYGDADHSARLEAGIAALQMPQAQPPAGASPSRVSYRQVAITAPPPAQADPVTIAAAAAARAQAGLRRTVSQASVASGSDSGTGGGPSSQRGFSRSVSAVSTADVAGGAGSAPQNGRPVSQQQHPQQQQQQQGGFSQPRHRGSLPSRSFEMRPRGPAGGSYGRPAGTPGPFEPAGRGLSRKSGSRTSRDSTASESASSQGAGAAGPTRPDFALEDDFPSLSVASRLASRSR